MEEFLLIMRMSYIVKLEDIPPGQMMAYIKDMKPWYMYVGARRTFSSGKLSGQRFYVPSRIHTKTIQKISCGTPVIARGIFSPPTAVKITQYIKVLKGLSTQEEAEALRDARNQGYFIMSEGGVVES